jgi:hypothetical protein
MNLRKLLTVTSVGFALAATANAQFSVSGPGSLIPTSGSGGGGTTLWPTVMPPFQGESTVTVAQAVTSIDSIVVDGFAHTWAGDLQMTLVDPAGTEHLIFLRPGFLNTSNFGSNGDFDGGQYTFVEMGGATLPTSSTNTSLPAGTYNQTFNSGGTTWPSGTNNINNTPMSTIAGAAGDWKLRIYDWAGGDTGSMTGWTLNGNGGGGGNSGMAYCFGDGTGTACPCSGFGGTGEGCMTTSGSGALLTGTGNANTAGDSFVLTVSGGPANKPGIFFQGPNPLGNFAGDGILCTAPNMRYDLNALDGSGGTTQTNFGINASSAQIVNYQYWFRDPGNTCGGLFNFSNGWTVTWL